MWCVESWRSLCFAFPTWPHAYPCTKSHGDHSIVMCLMESSWQVVGKDLPISTCYIKFVGCATWRPFYWQVPRIHWRDVYSLFFLQIYVLHGVCLSVGATWRSFYWQVPRMASDVYSLFCMRISYDDEFVFTCCTSCLAVIHYPRWLDAWIFLSC